MVKFLFLIFGFLFFVESAPDFPPPPGTLKVAENLFLDKEPITYLAYLEYISYIKRTNPDEAERLIPANLSITYKNEILWNNPNYIDFPIVGLSEAQMQSYCKWRSKVVNQAIQDQKSSGSEESYWSQFSKVDPSGEYSVVYTIPTAQDVDKFNTNESTAEFNEYLADGSMIEKRIDSGNFNKEDVYIFRCIAEYKRVN